MPNVGGACWCLWDILRKKYKLLHLEKRAGWYLITSWRERRNFLFINPLIFSWWNERRKCRWISNQLCKVVLSSSWVLFLQKIILLNEKKILSTFYLQPGKCQFSQGNGIMDLLCFDFHIWHLHMFIFRQNWPCAKRICPIDHY